MPFNKEPRIKSNPLSSQFQSPSWPPEDYKEFFNQKPVDYEKLASTIYSDLVECQEELCHYIFSIAHMSLILQKAVNKYSGIKDIPQPTEKEVMDFLEIDNY